MTAVETAASAVSAEARQPLVVVEDLVKHFPLRGGVFGRRQRVHSVDGVSLTIAPGEVLGLVGESGCGKSTLARAMLGLTPVDSGRVLFDGTHVAAAKGAARKALRRSVQLVFQDPYAALDPRMRLETSLDAPLAQHGMGTREERHHRIVQALNRVGLDESFLDRRPRECSGGQLQRVVVARALLLNPRLLICDEPTSALDASIRAQILNLLIELKNELDLTLLMISHDLRVVRHICDRVAVMYLGEIVEVAPREDLFERPAHPYTQALLASSLPERPGADRAFPTLRGEPPSPVSPPAGCRFHPRCPRARDRCSIEPPALSSGSHGHLVSCHYPDA
ncbi:ABC transporter ATP-binding protein [Streptomyces sp. PSKA54]|uniref:ABC transporter ATP-binding protein n=1 Tax=Streptomyces himalayensis subsp. aureolus TaxID=2758039 RepID=A0A7W2D3V9_9ACTN|nr:ABC transporter ATP-binding protein [Streptomyces himalayensis]MBA4864288.1 ABC transporter ATP-binding protein [Streptomyces himalayensis subsp. aureolus]